MNGPKGIRASRSTITRVSFVFATGLAKKVTRRNRASTLLCPVTTKGLEPEKR